MKKKLKTVLMLALPYAITVFLPMISVLCLGSMIVADYHQKIIVDRQKSIEVAFERFLQRIDNVMTLSHTIAQSNVMTEYAYGSLRNAEHSLIDNMEVRDLLSDFGVNDDVAMMYFYDAGGNRIITSDAVLSNAEIYFKYEYQLEGYTTEECIERLKTLSRGYEFSSGMKVGLEYNNIIEVIEYRISVPLNVVSNLPSQLVMVMEVEDIFGDFFDILDESSEFYIYDSRDRLIYGSGNRYEELLDVSRSTDFTPVQKEDDDIYGIVCHSPDGYWRLKAYIPNLMNSGEGDTMSPYVWLLMGIPLAASTILCIYFTFRNHREIQEILMLFKGQKKAGDGEAVYQEPVGYKEIMVYADKILNENSRFKEKLTRFECSRKYEILDKLIRNTYGDREEMVHALTNEDLYIQDGKCAVLCIRYKGSCYRTFVAEDITIKDLVKGLLSELIGQKFEVFDTSSRETICVLSIDETDMETIVRDIISGLNVEVAYYYNIEVEIGVGDVVDSMYYMSDSYAHAKDVIRYRETSGQKVYLYSELIQLEDVYYYPREFDEKIYNYLVVGKKEEAKEIIHKIYKENFEDNDRKLSVNAIKAMKGRLKDSMVSLVEKYDISMDGIPSELNGEQNINEFFDAVYRAAEMIAEKIVNKKKIVQQHSAGKIMQYIEENYCDNMLSLKKISSVLGLHENYISNLFRSEYGENLSVFIERQRIEKACELLKKSDMRISDIAQTVGYSTDASFRRVFKKIAGMSPAEYRGE